MRILAFAPHSAIWIHAFPEALALEAMRQRGHEILHVGCGGVLRSHCVSMSGCGVPFESTSSAKGRICRSCNQNASIIRRRFGFTYQDLEQVVSEEDIEFATRSAEALTPENCRHFILEGTEIGRIAPYELLIQKKKADFSFTEDEWQRYLASVRNVIVVMRAVTRIIEEFRPDVVTVYNALYAVNRVVCKVCERRGVRQYFIHAGDNLARRLSTLIVAKDQAFSYYEHLRSCWREIKEVPTSPVSMSRATDHFLEVLKGKSPWAYSAAPTGGRDLLKTFNLPQEAEVICATLSSEDERMSSELIGVQAPPSRALYVSQLEWVTALIEYVTTKPNRYLIIRLHPREFPNKREGVHSEHARQLKIVLSNLPANVRINWPTDGVSLYDLANITDVFVNAWSSAGKEMAWLGIPVVLYAPELTIYPAELNYVATTEAEYFEAIELALREGWDPERIRRTYRWCAIEYDKALLDISDSYRGAENRSWSSRAFRAIVRRVSTSHYQERDCRNRARVLECASSLVRVVEEDRNCVIDLDAGAGAPSLEQETRCLKQEVGRLYRALYGEGRPSVADRGHKTSLEQKLRRFCFDED